MPVLRRHRFAPMLTLSLLLMAQASGCILSRSLAPRSPAVAERIPYEDVDRRMFVDAGLHVRTAHGNHVSVEVARRDTLVWFEDAHTGRFARAFLRRGNTIYVLTRDSDYVRGSPSQTVAYRLFMQAWRRANRTGQPTATSTYANEQ